MIKLLVIIAAFSIVKANLTSYKFQLESILPLVPSLLKNESLLEFYLPSIDTVILRFNHSVIVVNTILPDQYTEYPLPAQSRFIDGRYLSFISGSN